VLRFDSPSKNTNAALSPATAALSFIDAPLFLVSTAPAGTYQALAGIMQQSGNDHTTLLAEASLYELATFRVPEWVTVERIRTEATQVQSASVLYGPPSSVVLPTHITPPWSCQPELFTVASPGHPGFT
jgi:hypothetical protein